MKKLFSALLALALTLSAVASFAFVLGPNTTVTVGTNSALNITKFYTTYDSTNLLAGTRLYSEIVDKTDDAFAKNALIQFVVEFEVLNALVPSNNIDTANNKDAGTATLTFTSDTVDLSVNQYAGQMALYCDAGYDLVNAVNVVTNTAGQGCTYTNDKNSGILNTLQIEVDFTQNGARINGFDDKGIAITGPTSYKEASSTYTLIFSGITKGEITDQGAVVMKTGYSDSFSVFGNVTAAKSDNTAASIVPNAVIVERNGRSYLVEKVAALWNVTTANYAYAYANDTTAIGYKVTLGTAAPYGTTNYGQIVYDTPVAQFDTEVVTYNLPGNADINGTDIEGYGSSLGLVDLLSTDDASDDIRVFKTVLNDGSTVYLRADGSKAFASDDGALARFNIAMNDLGFSTEVGYTYKLTDSVFTTAASYAETRSATYNNGTVIPIEPEEDEEPDVDEPTDEEPIEEEPIEEEPIEDEDPWIDEEPIEDEDIYNEVPVTGDFSANLSILLAAAALTAAAALALVLKKARG